MKSSGSDRQVVPSCESAGTTGEPLAFAIVIVIGAANWVTGVPASAHLAVTSISWLPGARLGANAASAGDGSTRRTRKSSAVGVWGQAVAGTETVASDPAEVRTDVWVGDALSSTGGRSAAGVLSIVTATRKGALVPVPSSRRPESTCSPSESEPVANVKVEPETVGAGAGAPSSMAPVTRRARSR